MKKRKFKLLASLTSLVLVVAVMAVGVWAATGQKLTITSEVGFTATGISGTLTANVTGTDAGAYNTSGSSTFSPSVDIASTWAIGSIQFNPDATTGIPTDIVYKVTVLNSGSKGIAVTLTLPQAGDPLADVTIEMDENITAVIKTSTDITDEETEGAGALTAPPQSPTLTNYTNWGSAFTGTDVNFTIAAGATGGFAVVLHVEDYATSIDAFDINFNVNLAAAS